MNPQREKLIRLGAALQAALDLASELADSPGPDNLENPVHSGHVWDVSDIQSQVESDLLPSEIEAAAHLANQLREAPISQQMKRECDRDMKHFRREMAEHGRKYGELAY